MEFKTIPVSILIIFFGLIFLVSVNAQEKIFQPERCGTTIQFHENRLNTDPDYAKFIRQHSEFIQQNKAFRNPDCGAGPIIVPVAVHFDAGVVPTDQQSCAIELVEDQIAALIIEINGDDPQNSVYAPLQSCFPGNPAIGNSCVDFCLATFNHPGGYGLSEGEVAVTFGQIDFTVTSGSGSSVPFDANWAGYLNIYVDNLSGGLLGQAAGIPGDFSGEGVVIDACTFGTGNVDCTGMNSSASCGGIYNEGNTLTHEVGHYLGLRHIWGDNSNCSGNQDFIDDTPDMDSNYSGYTNCSDNNCTDLPESCSSKDMYMNYMSYAGDACMYMFTSEQADVMNLTCIAAGFSTSLPNVCSLPEAPVADFSFSPDPAILCPGNAIIQFTDESTGPPTQWSWTFSGAGVSPLSSSLRNPIVSLSTAGNLSATLTASNAAGTSAAYSEIIPVSFLDENDPACQLCTYRLELFDSYGDGWNGAELEVLLDGVSEGTYTLTSGSFIEFDIEVTDGSSIELIYAGGSYDSEVSFDLIDAFDYIVFHQDPSPPDATVYSGDISCLAPTCNDGIKNGAETGVDCGGPDCPNCPVCNTMFYDSGGANSNYSNEELSTWTFCPDNQDEVIELIFTSFDIEDHASCGYDVLSIYNGTTDSELIGEYCGDQVPAPIRSTAVDGCLYIVFDSDTYVTGSGWEAQINCVKHCTVVTTILNDGYGSFRAALECAQSGDTITFDPSISGETILISGSNIQIDKDITISDPGESVTIQSAAVTPLIEIQTNKVVTIAGVRITGTTGSASPILLNQGDLTLKNVVINDLNPSNDSEIIRNEANLWIENTVEINKQ